MTTAKLKRELYQLTAEIEGISDSINTLAHSVYGGCGDVTIKPETIAKQLWSISNYLDRITEDLEAVDRSRAKPKSVTVTHTYNY